MPLFGEVKRLQNNNGSRQNSNLYEQCYADSAEDKSPKPFAELIVYNHLSLFKRTFKQ